MSRLSAALALLAPAAARAHSGPHLHPHGGEWPLVALATLAGVAALVLAMRRLE